MEITANNPYERRHGGRAAGETRFDVSGMMLESRPLVPPPRALQIDELEAMVFSAYRRGRDEERDAALERERLAAMGAWEDGHERGVTRGWAAAAQVAEAQFGGRLSELHAMATERIGMIERMRAAGTSPEATRAPEAILAAEANALQGCVQFFEDLSLQMARRFPRREEDRGAPAD